MTTGARRSTLPVFCSAATTPRTVREPPAPSTTGPTTRTPCSTRAPAAIAASSSNQSRSRRRMLRPSTPPGYRPSTAAPPGPVTQHAFDRQPARGDGLRRGRAAPADAWRPGSASRRTACRVETRRDRARARARRPAPARLRRSLRPAPRRPRSHRQALTAPSTMALFFDPKPRQLQSAAAGRGCHGQRQAGSPSCTPGS